MATGTGKTITSLICAKQYLKENKRIFLIILVPLRHLAEQWESNLKTVGFNNCLKCYDLKSKWINKYDTIVRDFNLGITKVECVIAVYKTASTKDFQAITTKIRNNSVLIADECHNFGMKSFEKHQLNNISSRIGLSATPERWFDEEGTERLFQYFSKVVYEYDIQKAIDNRALVPYEYEPIVVDLLTEELKKYERLTTQLIRLINTKDKSKEERIEKLNRERSLIISKAYQKKILLYSMLKTTGVNEISHTLVYCAPGEIDDITYNISNLDIKVHRFNSKVKPKDRIQILEAFDKKEIQVLVAIKCLDEGVDIPNTRVAYFLASTSNPREFVQRRGRVLRKANGKTKAKIYDFIVLPTNVNEITFKRIAYKEMPRFAEFSKYAINKYIARNKVKGILEKVELEYLMDKLPWELYKEMKELYRR